MQRSIDGIMFHEGIPSKEDLMEARGDDRRHMICVLDDLLHDLANDRWAQELIYVSSHHLNITVCLVGHNMYEKGKVMRTLSLNMHYYILFENRRDSSRILRFGRQKQKCDDGNIDDTASYNTLKMIKKTNNTTDGNISEENQYGGGASNPFTKMTFESFDKMHAKQGLKQKFKNERI
ncbi:unnamed protein product [Mytilus coruscus]|uniref:Uncharacterized protein n=1 Tax=Mytilus coruscus TaxID=42192 RepID=A0A6J7ZXB0_MYTCO|nr:unnamed protein product [Mytilus coruscus]